MEDILASIRKILSDDETKADEPLPPAPESELAAASVAPEDDDVLSLDESMLVQQEQKVAEAALRPEPVPAAEPEAVLALVAPEAAAAAASSVESLMRTLHTEQSMRVTSSGPTIEDIVRQEIRPLLKAWLDANLPPLVERLVRTEIERVVGRVRT
jgi:cell pole-organizing protein PopZ